MSVLPGEAAQRRGRDLGLLVLVCLAAGLAYARGLDGQFLFDDYANLTGLGAIQSDPTPYTIVQYALSGASSELGRPLSLLSFAAQAASWDQRPQDFIAANIGLHLLNGVLWYGLLVALQRAGGLPRSRFFPVAATALWLVMPIHVATVLYVVQRMAMLATTCFLAGSLLYVHGRLRLATDATAGYVRMAAGIFVGTILGTLCKETAALTPVMLLILEATLLSRLPRPPGWKRAAALLLILPSLALAAYLVLELPHFIAGYSIRTFTPGERLLTECRVLLVYLADGLLPSSGSVRMLYDDYPLSTSVLAPPTTAVALAAWATALLAAIRWRRRYPVLTLVVGWYVVANALESSVIPLEIAFTHRSYLPLLAPALGLAVLAFEVAVSPAASRLRGLVLGGSVAYVLLLFAGLWRASTLWGEPLEQARSWLRAQPTSQRAVLTYGNLLLRRGDLDATVLLYAAARKRMPEDAVVELSAYELGCFAPGTAPSLGEVSGAVTRYRGAEVTVAAGIVHSIASRIEQGHCPPLPPADVLAITDAMLASPHFNGKHLTLLHTSAMLLASMGQKAAALTRIEQAIALDPQIPLLQQAVLWSLELGDPARARAHLQTAEQSPRISARRRWLFRREIAGTRQLVSLYESLPDR